MKLSCGVREVQKYFEHSGFERFHALNCTNQPRPFQQLVRRAHDATLATVLNWLNADNDLSGRSVCDAGCGLGALSIQLALQGASVLGVDFSQRMITQAQRTAATLQAQKRTLEFKVADLANVEGRFDTAVCIDVFARYSMPQVLHLLSHMTGIARSRCVISFTPKTLFDKPLLALGNAYARRHGLPPIYTHRSEAIVKAVQALGWDVHRQRHIASPFKIYFCCVMELRRRSPEPCERAGFDGRVSPRAQLTPETAAEPGCCPFTGTRSTTPARTPDSMQNAFAPYRDLNADRPIATPNHAMDPVDHASRRGALC